MYLYAFWDIVASGSPLGSKILSNVGKVACISDLPLKPKIGFRIHLTEYKMASLLRFEGVSACIDLHPSKLTRK